MDRTLPSCPLSKNEKMIAKAKIAKREEFAICDVHKICNLLDPKKHGCDLTPNEQAGRQKIVIIEYLCTFYIHLLLLLLFMYIFYYLRHNTKKLIFLL